jgi:hypothetical protein
MVAGLGASQFKVSQSEKRREEKRREDLVGARIRTWKGAAVQREREHGS